MISFFLKNHASKRSNNSSNRFAGMLLSRSFIRGWLNNSQRRVLWSLVESFYIKIYSNRIFLFSFVLTLG